MILYFAKPRIHKDTIIIFSQSSFLRLSFQPSLTNSSIRQGHLWKCQWSKVLNPNSQNLLSV